MPQSKLFVSYRRTNWSFTYWLAEELSKLMDVQPFVDYAGIDETDFESSLLRNLRESDAVLLIVTEDTFSPSRIHHDKDWVRREIREALALNKPIVLACHNGVFPPADLPDDIQAIRKVQGIEFYPRYFKAGVQELAVFLDKATPLKLYQPISIPPAPSPTETVVKSAQSLRVLWEEAINLHEGGQYDRAIELYQQLIKEHYQTQRITVNDCLNYAIAERNAEQRHWEAGQIYDEIAALFRIDRERGMQEYAKFLKDYPEFTDDPAGLKQKNTPFKTSPLTVEPKSPIPLSMSLLTLLFGTVSKTETLIVDKHPTKLPKVHSEMINNLAFSADGRLLASAGGGRFGGDTRIQLWDIATEKQIGVLEGHMAATQSITFNPDSKLLASGSNDKTLRLWSVSEQHELAVLEGHTDYINSVAFSPDGQLLASGSRDKTIRLWSVSEQRELAMLEGHTLYIFSIAFSPDGQLLISCSGDKTLRLWSVSEPYELVVYKGHTDYINSVAFSPDGQLLASCSGDKTVRLWSVSEPRELAVLRGHNSFVNTVAFSPDGQLLASAGLDQDILLWHIK